MNQDQKSFDLPPTKKTFLISYFDMLMMTLHDKEKKTFQFFFCAFKMITYDTCTV